MSDPVRFGLLTDQEMAELGKDLDLSLTKKRKNDGGAGELPYMPTDAVIRNLNRIFGYAQWSYKVIEIMKLGEDNSVERERNGQQQVGTRVAYRALCRLELANGAVYEDVGWGDGTGYGSPLLLHEKAEKEAVSDALKRCARNLGDQFALALWDKDSPEHSEAVGATAHRERTSRQQAITDNMRKRILAACTEMDIDDDTRHRITRMIVGVTSLKEVPRNQGQALLKNIVAYGQNQATAAVELATWERENLPTEGVEA